MHDADDERSRDRSLDGHLHDDGAAYVDAATIALRYASVELGPALGKTPSRPAPPVTPRALRDAMGCLVTGVCVVTAIADGEDVAMTANSVTSVSLDPPMILVCIAKTARFHDVLVDTPHWGVSVLDADAAEVSAHFARPGRARRGQLAQTAYHRGPVTGVALVDDSCAHVECRTEVVYPGGDHSIVVGRVVSTEVRAESVHPLVFHRGSYSWLRG
jgi:flavin reductase (DIM6/NTAB) family NADH-FMN oxidoreductase RutF